MEPYVYVDLYLRLSDGRDLATIDAREAQLRREAARRDWMVFRVVRENDLVAGKSRTASAFKRRKIILPNGERAMRVVRPGFRSILDDIAEGRVQAMLAEDLDRVVRDPRDGEDLLDVAEAMKATIDSLSDSLRLTKGGTDAEIYAFRANVNAANKASKDTARRVAAGRERTAYAGQWAGGPRPYGFTPEAHPSGNHQNTVLVVNEEEAMVIRKMADQVLEGISLASIARGLRERNVPTATGRAWEGELVSQVLSKPLCAGIVVFRREETDVRLPGKPILSEDTWRAVVAKLNSPLVEWADRNGNTRSYPRSTASNKGTSNAGRAPLFLGSGIYHCVCGSTMEITKWPGRSPTYRCARNETGAGDTHVRRNAELLDKLVARTAVERLADADAFALLMKAAKPEVDVTGLRRESLALRERLDELGRAFADGDIDREQLAAGTRRHRARLDSVNEQLASTLNADHFGRLVSPFNPLTQLADTAGKWLGLSTGEQRAIIRHLMIVTVLPTRSSRTFDENDVRIEWVTS